jgi:hypothetical protein
MAKHVSNIAALENYMTLPPYERRARAAWYSLMKAAEHREQAYREHLTARVDSETAARVEELGTIVPGLTTSAACRLLIILGLENLMAIKHYAPEVLADAVRADGTPFMNSARLASMVCPLTASALEELTETAREQC